MYIQRKLVGKVIIGSVSYQQ